MKASTPPTKSPASRPASRWSSIELAVPGLDAERHLLIVKRT
jgi:hypothetical protein